MYGKFTVPLYKLLRQGKPFITMSNEFEVRSDLNNEYVGGVQMLIINKGKELAY